MTTLVQVGRNGRIALPKAICEAVGMRVGDLVRFEVMGDDIVLSAQDGPVTHSEGRPAGAAVHSRGGDGRDVT